MAKRNPAKSLNPDSGEGARPAERRKAKHAPESLPILDLRALTDAQLSEAERVFEDFRDIELMPAYQADIDPNRALPDRALMIDVLGLDEGIHNAVRRLAAKWCAEPSVHGGKKGR